VEFDVFFGHLDKKRFQFGQEVTINWQTHSINSEGIFYTDANAYKVVKRMRDQPDRKYPFDSNAKAVPVPTYFYPVNSGVFIEDVS
jgi:hypothetical protein